MLPRMVEHYLLKCWWSVYIILWPGQFALRFWVSILQPLVTANVYMSTLSKQTIMLHWKPSSDMETLGPAGMRVLQNTQRGHWSLSIDLCRTLLMHKVSQMRHFPLWWKPTSFFLASHHVSINVYCVNEVWLGVLLLSCWVWTWNKTLICLMETRETCVKEHGSPQVCKLLSNSLIGFITGVKNSNQQSKCVDYTQ